MWTRIFDPTTALGVVVLGILTAAIVGILGRYRARITPPLRRLALRLPRRVKPVLIRIAYAVYPTWRSYSPRGERSISSLDRRVQILSSRPRLPTVLVGGAYLDVHLRPVERETLINPAAKEYANLGEVRTTAGGSAFFVGQYLYDVSGRKSFFFSRVGKGDFFSRHLKRTIQDSQWIRGDNISVSRSSQCAVSIHLLSPDGAPLPTYTHRGALLDLTWRRILKDVQHCFRRGGGVLYISGYFRTALDIDLAESVSSVSPDVLVIVDHGRFKKEDCRPALRSLVDSFQSGMVDIYVCTYTELLEYAAGAGVDVTIVDGNYAEAVRQILRAGILPRVTVVRGDARPHHQATALVAMDGDVRELTEGPQDWVPRGEPGGRSAFTAGLISNLYAGRGRNISEVVELAAREGLRAWEQWG
jgi:hypothetical protein